MTRSPTGDLIAFITSGSQPSSLELRVLDVATGEVTTVFEGERRTYLTIIGFSPQGERILFSKIEDNQKGELSLWSIGLDGSDPRLVVAGTSQGDWLSP